MTVTKEPVGEQTFSIWRTLRLGTFQVGSAMGDVLLAGIWNRIVISDFGLPAWPVGLLIAMRYFMTPLSIWAGNRSDNRPLFGSYRTSYIWLGRGLMLIAFLVLGTATVELEIANYVAGWALAFASFLLYGMGTLLSGSVFLALVRDSAPPSKQGIAIGLVETILIAMFPVVAIGFSRMLTSYDRAAFWQLLITVVAIAGFFWFFAIFRVEKRRPVANTIVDELPLRAIFDRIWADQRTRGFFKFLFVATFAAWMQDNILEPFGADVFGLEVEQTTRLTSYWGTATILVLVICFAIWRQRRPERQAGVARIGLLIMASGLVLVCLSALMAQTHVFYAGLVIFGTGFGFYTFGGLSLMAVMSPDPNAGAYLGLWSICILVSKGMGTFAGGLMRDLGLAFGLTNGVTYALIFFIASIGLAAAVLILRSEEILGFARETGRLDQPIDLPIGAMD
ncbi:MAG: BCD family MFS transporter [Ardenticatenales bacterium]|nr:BCD family MFS transporter [Ardenticatenales bacterium]